MFAQDTPTAGQSVQQWKLPKVSFAAYPPATCPSIARILLSVILFSLKNPKVGAALPAGEGQRRSWTSMRRE